MSESNDQDMLLCLSIPIVIVVIFIICVEGLSSKWNEIASIAWLIVLIYSLIVCLYELSTSFII